MWPDLVAGDVDASMLSLAALRAGQGGVLVRLSPLPQQAERDWAFLGTPAAAATARGIAYGYLHPETHAPFQDSSPSTECKVAALSSFTCPCASWPGICGGTPAR